MRLVDCHCHLNAERFAGDGGPCSTRAGGRSRADPRSRLERRLDGARPGAGRRVRLARRLRRRASPRRREGRRRRVARIAASAPRARGRRHRGDRPRLRTASSRPDPGPARQPPAEPRAGARDGQAGDPPRPVAERPADAQDAIVEELRRAGFGAQRSVGVFGPDRPPAVIHSFSGSVDYAPVLDLGLAISISGLAFRAGRSRPPTSCRSSPADRLLVETDSPFLAPPGAPRGRNEPEWVRITAAGSGSVAATTRKRPAQASWPRTTGRSREPPAQEALRG